MKFNAKAAILLASFLLSGAGFVAQLSFAASFNNVQVFANPADSHAGAFQFAAYNLSGGLVASYQSPYPAAAFELPSGGYLFTVSATDYIARAAYACPLAQSGGGVAKPGATSPSQPAGSSSPKVLPWCYPPSSEYGYAVATVSGPQTINIDLKNASALPTTSVAVKVSYVNGTAVEGANVYASVVGEWYYWWWYENAALNMSSHTDRNGIAHLVVPVAPTVTTAWKWVPIYTKANTTVKTNVGGQEINVTAYWEPAWVGLSGSGLVIPPQTSVAITIRYQQPDYWVMAGGATSKQAYVNGAPSATVASQPGGTPSAVSASNIQSSTGGYLPSQIPAFQVAESQQTNNSVGPSTAEIAAIGAAIFVAGGLAVFAMARRRSANPPIH